MQFVQEDFADQVASILEETGLSPQYLELELTERRRQRLRRVCPSDAAPQGAWRPHRHRRLRHRLLLPQLPASPAHRPDQDRPLLHSVMHEPNGSLPIVEAIISMSQSLGLGVVGEGVETMEQMSTLCRKGCNLLQGYLFSAPSQRRRRHLYSRPAKSHHSRSVLRPAPSPPHN